MPETESPFFSVVIPSYNRAHLIEKTIDSILAQTFRDYEIIVIDNCSTDNTVSVLQQYSSLKNFRLIVNDRNYERSYSRNVGFKNAKGKFLTLIDSDDQMYPSCLSDAYDFSIQYPTYQVFHNYFVLVNEKGDVIYRYKFPEPKNFKKTICLGNFMSCIGAFMSKEVYSKYEFDLYKDLIGSEDWDFWLRVLAEYDLGVIPKINCAVLHHEERSINSFTIQDTILRKQYVINKLRTDTKLKRVYAKYIDKMEASVYLFASSMANKNMMYTEARSYAMKALQLDFAFILSYRFLRNMHIALLKIKKEAF